MKNKYANAAQDEAFRRLVTHPEDIPFCFTYGGAEYKGFGEKFFKLKNRDASCIDGRETHTLTFDLRGELEVSVKLTYYASHGVYEFTVWFENVGRDNSRVVEAPRAELTFRGERPTLKGILGDHLNQYSPYTMELEGTCVEFCADSGLASHVNFPYFNLEYGDGGAMLAIGWAGTWNARFASDGKATTYTATAVNGLKTYLRPGEKIRSALFLIAPYTTRNEHYATNFWRSFFITHILPKKNANGDSLRPFSTCGLALDTGLPTSDGSISECHTTWRPSFEGVVEHGVTADYRWVDAGWYVLPDGRSAEAFVDGADWWESIGTWELDPIKWPGNSFRESTDYAREHGMKTLLWFEPERVTDPESLAARHGYNTDWAIRNGMKNSRGFEIVTNNLGDPECRKWTAERICKLLSDNKIELYREDNNCKAARLWRYWDSLEGEDRCGITESKLIDGHYKLWDEIIACTLSFGGAGFIDSCASGGGRNDIETMRRSVPLLRSDSDRSSAALRLSMTHSLARWIPFHGTSGKELREIKEGHMDTYAYRASYLPIFNFKSLFAQEPDGDFSALKAALTEWKSISPYLLCDFYPLTPWHKEKDTTAFTAFAYHNAEDGTGILLAFRQERCPKDTLYFSLPFAKSGEVYELTDEDTGEKIAVSGIGTIFFKSPRTAKLFRIKRIG